LTQKSTEQAKCPECGNKILQDPDTGENFCGNCGLVLGSRGDLLSPRAEWSAYTTQEEFEKSRTAPLSPTERTQIGLTLGKRGILKPPTAQTKRWRRYQSQTTSSKERNLIIATQTLKTIAGKLNLPPNVRELAMVIYKKALVEKNLVRGRTIACMVAASLYFACRILKIPRSLSDFSKITQFSEKEIANNYRLLLQELRNDLGRQFNIKVQTPNYLQSIEQITGNLNLSVETAELAAKIVRMTEEKKITHGKSPKGIDGAAIYIAGILSDEKRTQKEIADKAQVTEVTIRNIYKILKQKLRQELKIETVKKPKIVRPPINNPATSNTIRKRTKELTEKTITELELPETTLERARQIFDSVPPDTIAKVLPRVISTRGFAAAIVVRACVEDKQTISAQIIQITKTAQKTAAEIKKIQKNQNSKQITDNKYCSNAN
jgi:transcription initiation factor TFIIB